MQERETKRSLSSLSSDISVHISTQEEDDGTEGTDFLHIRLNIRQYKTTQKFHVFSKGMFYKICEYPRTGKQVRQLETSRNFG